MTNETTAIATRSQEADKIERVLIGGDIAQLKPEERVSYYRMVCESVGLNPLTKPFAYITLNGKLTLYALKDCTDQLRTINAISVKIVAREVVDDCFIVTADASTPTGRTDSSIGAVSIASLKGESKANAMMKAETKAKRRVTLSICGLGILDESEIESIPSARAEKPPVAVTTEAIPIRKPAVQTQAVATPQGQDPPANYHPDVEVLQPTAAQAFDQAAAKGADQAAEIPMCGKAENRSFYAEFRKALLPELQARTEDIGRAWLKNRGCTKDDGTGSLQRVEKALFPEIIREATQYAKGLH